MPWKHRALLGLALLWLLCATSHLLFQGLGIVPTGPLAYAFTWDMFPHFQNASVRRVAIGETRSGRYIQLHPSPRQQFLEGVRHDLTRADLERSGAYFQSIVEETRQRTRAERVADPLVRVMLFEQSWPLKFNFQEENYRRWMGEPKPDSLGMGRPGPPGLDAPPEGVPHATWSLRREYAVDESTGAETELAEGSPP